ncbi:hypothetical protein HZA26_03370 [Candidatus Nomurabacteria bacterium]|nr:hypothetical protein [Candidatus Nomurabacteria bacterium]
MDLVRKFLMVLVLALYATTASAQGRVVGTVGEYIGHPVYLIEAPNARSRDMDYMLGTLPRVGEAPFPVIAFLNNYSVIVPPGDTNYADHYYANLFAAGVRGFSDDLVPPEHQFELCSTPTGKCPLAIMAPGPLWDLGTAGNVSFKPHHESNVTWALQNGYAVVVIFTRTYAGRDIQSTLLNVRNMLSTLKNFPGIIDPERIGITGGSQGGQLSIHSLIEWNFDGRPIHLAASVAEVPWADVKEMFKYYFDDLPKIQPPNLYQATHDFTVGATNRLKGGLGPDTSAPTWDQMTRRNVGERLRTPVMLFGSTDDGMCPVSEIYGLHHELARRGKISYLWAFQNGAPPLTTKSVPDIVHGRVDSGHATQRQILGRYMFLKHMPPNVGRVVMHHPSEVDLVGMFREFAQVYFGEFPGNPGDVLNLVDMAANPLIWYESSDPRIPSGPSPQVIQAVIQYVLSTR